VFVHCENPKCGFLLDISPMLGLKLGPEGPAPECFAGSPQGCADKGHFENCQDCLWRDFASE
ncbi:unnamed protein product, partial [marine sediment metagenome]